MLMAHGSTYVCIIYIYVLIDFPDSDVSLDSLKGNLGMHTGTHAQTSDPKALINVSAGDVHTNPKP